MSYIYKQRFKTHEGCSKRVAERNRHENQRPLRRCYFSCIRLILCPDQRWREDPLEYDKLTAAAGRYRWAIKRYTKKEIERQDAISHAVAILIGEAP